MAGSDDKRVVAEMMSDDNSPHWEEWRVFATRLALKLKVPAAVADDIVQQSLFSARKSLAEFRYECSLRSWMSRIVANKVLDELRRHIRDRGRFISLDMPKDPNEPEYLEIATPHTVEETYLQREKLREVFARLEEFVGKHAHCSRNALILHLFMVEGYTCEEVAKKLGINRPVVYAVIRGARIYLRQHMEE
jgi:RNA polymerase sigma factor (sigma-70 family)